MKKNKTKQNKTKKKKQKVFFHLPPVDRQGYSWAFVEL